MALFPRRSNVNGSDSRCTIRIFKNGVQIVFINGKGAGKHLAEKVLFPWYLKGKIRKHIKKLPEIYPDTKFKMENYLSLSITHAINY